MPLVDVDMFIGLLRQQVEMMRQQGIIESAMKDAGVEPGTHYDAVVFGWTTALEGVLDLITVKSDPKDIRH